MGEYVLGNVVEDMIMGGEMTKEEREVVKKVQERYDEKLQELADRLTEEYFDEKHENKFDRRQKRLDGKILALYEIRNKKVPWDKLEREYLKN